MEKGWVAAAGIGLLLWPGAGLAQVPAFFATVDQSDEELEADGVLADQLTSALVTRPKAEGYKTVIDDLVADNRSEGTVARA